MAREGERRDAYRILVGKLEGMRPARRHRPDGRVILKWDLKKRQGIRLDSTGTGEGQVVGCCECRNERSGSMKLGNSSE
jgi:hypothetical protein